MLRGCEEKGALLHCWWECKLVHIPIAKSLQSCSTLCDPTEGSPQAPPSLGFSRQEHWSGLPFPSLSDSMDCGPPGSPVHGVFQAKELEWDAIAFSNAGKWKVKVKVLSHVRLFSPMDCSPPGSCIPGILQARTLEWGATAFSAGFMDPGPIE